MRNSWVPRVVTLVVLSTFFIPDVAFGRIRLPERNGKAILLPRRIVGSQPKEIGELSGACPPGIGTCAQLAGAFISTLLAASPECAQQDACDGIIDASRQFDAKTQANIVALAIQLRKAEKNTQLNFSAQPPTKRNSLFCQKCPRNQELIGLVQAQDPANNPNIFADPITGKDVIKGTQPDTEPFKGPCPTTSTNNSAVINKAATKKNPATSKTSNTNDAATNKTDKANGLASVCKSNTKTSGPSTSSKNTTSLLSSGASGANFGSCSPPEIKFAAGLDNRKETAFAPVDPASYTHGSAQNIGVITQFMCDALTNTCKANQPAKDLCAQAQTAANAATPPKSGAQADTFNQFFGFKTDFSAVTIIDDTGKPVGGTGTPNNGTSLLNSGTGTGTSGANFGSCTTPEIKFAAGLDNRKETAFAPNDPKSYPHGSAQGIENIDKSMCDQLTNTCGANQAAKDLCAQAITAAEAAPAKTGTQADKFNEVFGIKTNFAAVTPLDDHGDPVGGGSAQPNNGTSLATSSASPNFGTCSTPQIKFGVGFDGRKETAFEPVDQGSYNHGSADNIGVITQFMCDALTNTCKANQDAKTLCTQAQAAASAAKAPTGAQADAFNAVFGLTTNFKNVTPISNTGVPLNN